MGRGRKTCPDCGEVTGVRTFQCSECGHRFKAKGNPKKAVQDWTELKEGVRVKSLQGRGPYFMDKSKGRIPMGYYGDFIIKDVKDDGLVAVATSGDERGQFVFIYMGPEKVSKHTGLNMEPHYLEYSDKKDHPGWKKVAKKVGKL